MSQTFGIAVVIHKFESQFNYIDVGNILNPQMLLYPKLFGEIDGNVIGYNSRRGNRDISRFNWGLRERGGTVRCRNLPIVVSVFSLLISS